MKEGKGKRPARGSRREFTKKAAALLAAAPLALTGAAAQTQPPAREPKAPPNPQPTPAPQQAQAPPSPVAAAYAEVARARFGEQLSPDELARVRRDLEGNVRSAERLRAHKLSNADEPDFCLQGIKTGCWVRGVRCRESDLSFPAPNTSHPAPSFTNMLPKEIFFAPVTELAAQIRARRVSPVELAEGYLERLETVGRRLGAVATVMRETALGEAREAEREIRRGRYRGPLHGVPYGVKDLLATRGAPTTWGAAPYKDQRFDFDAAVVRRLREAGAVLLGKLAMIELAGGMGYNQADASLTGACLTPWNTGFWSGGSSSGPGAAVAAALVGFAVGSETSGSIITPAAFCGVSGLRPTYGLVSRHGAMALSWTLDKLGPMCRSAEDCGLVLAAIAGLDPLDPTTRAPGARPAGRRRRRPRLAVVKDSYEKAQDEVRKNFLASLDVLRRFATVEMDVPLPDFPYGPAVGTIVDAEGASAFRELIESGRVRELASPEGRVGGYAASLVTAVDYLHAMRLRAPMRRAWAAMFEKYDALVAPSRASVAYPVDKTFDQAYPGLAATSPIGASNLVGVPAVSVPNGFGQHGLPTGIQFIAAAWAERDLVGLASRYQSATDWHRRRPPHT